MFTYLPGLPIPNSLYGLSMWTESNIEPILTFSLLLPTQSLRTKAAVKNPRCCHAVFTTEPNHLPWLRRWVSLRLDTRWPADYPIMARARGSGGSITRAREGIAGTSVTLFTRPITFQATREHRGFLLVKLASCVRSFVQCCFTSKETVWTIRDGGGLGGARGEGWGALSPHQLSHSS